MRVLNIIIIMLLTVLPLSAQEVGIDAVSSAGNNISGYMPVVRALCFALAGIVAIGGGYTCYYAILQGQEIRKRVIMTVGSALCFVAMALGLPQFFGYSDDGFAGSSLYADNMGGDGTSGGALSGDNQGVPGGGIDASIPDPSDPNSNYYQEMTSREVLTTTGLMNPNVSSLYYSIDYRDVMDREGDYGGADSYRMMDDAWNYIVSCGFDFNKAYSKACLDLEGCLYAESNGESFPWSSSDYRGICYAIQDLGNALWNSLPSEYRSNYGSPAYLYYYDMFNP